MKTLYITILISISLIGLASSLNNNNNNQISFPYGNSQTINTGNITYNITQINGTSIHNDLTGLQGGSSNEYYHLNQSIFNYLMANILSWSAGGGNASWNQSLADTLYYSITNPFGYYNSTNPSPTYNATYAGYNSTGLIRDWNNTGLIINWSTGAFVEQDPKAYNGTLALNTSLANYLLKTAWNATNTSYYLVTNPNAYYNSTTLNSTAYLVLNSTGLIRDWNNTGLIINWTALDNDTAYALYQFLNNNFNGSGNFTTTGNITSTNGGYLAGQPLTGMLGSGLIQSTQGASFVSGINVTCSGLVCSYNDFVMRINYANSATPAKYCAIPAGSITVPDNTNAMYYIDSNCAVQQTTYDTWFTTLLNQGGKWDFANILTHSGSAEIIDTISLEQRRLMKTRILSYYEWQSKVISGFNFQVNTFPQFNITSGKTAYGMDVVSVNTHNISSADKIEIVYHTGASTWGFNEQNGLNITTCDTGSGIADCSGANYRRHFIFSVGYDDTGATSKIHQLLPLQSLSYSTISQCLDTTANPVTYTLPNEYTGAAVMLYAYCAKRTDSSWTTGNLIDLRTTKTGAATGGTDISGLVPYSGATANVDLASYNLTASNIFAGNVCYSNGTNAYTYNSTYNAYNSTGLIRDWNISGYIVNWNSTGYILNWNASGLIKDWNSTGLIRDWSANTNNYYNSTTLNATAYLVLNASGLIKDWNASGWIKNQTPDLSAYYLASNPNGYYNSTSNLNNLSWATINNGTMATWSQVMNGTVITKANLNNISWANVVNGTVATWANVVNGTTALWSQVMNGTVITNANLNNISWANINNGTMAVNSSLANYVLKAGDTMTGNLSVSNNSLTSVNCIYFKNGGTWCSA
jgi:hypothetical protein